MTVAQIKSSRPKYQAMADDANNAVSLFIHRSAGQHARRMRESWPDAECIEISTQPAPLDPPGARGNVEFVGHEPGWFKRIFQSFLRK